MELLASIETKLADLEADLFRLHCDEPRISLMNGNGGLALLYYRLFEAKGNQQYREKAWIVLRPLMNSVGSTIRSFSYCDGLAGIAYLFNYLLDKDFIDEDTNDFLEECDKLLMTVCKKQVEKGNIDFLHGATGIGLYFLARYESNRISAPVLNAVSALLKEQLELLLRQGSPKDDYIPDPDNDGGSRYLNCGMAHGIVSSIMFLSKLHGQSPAVEKYETLLRGLVDRLLEFRSGDDRTLARFPSIVKMEHGHRHTTYDIPLGWCYGDSMVATGLYTASLALNDKLLAGDAEQLARRATTRRSPGKSLIRDACFCHGAASVAHIYRKWYEFSGDGLFLENYNYWISQTVSFCSFPDGIGGFKKFAGTTYSNEFGLLDGACGTALVLADYGHTSSDWDKFFLLS